MKENLEQNLDIYEEDTQKNKYLVFSLGEEFYGIDIMYVTEIVGIQPITEVPELPEYVKGIINLRGKIIPVMDARAKFQKEMKDYNDRTCIIVVDVKHISIGIIVDAVQEVRNIDDSNIVPPPAITISKNQYIEAIGKTSDQVILLLNSKRLLDDDEIIEIDSEL